MLAVDEFLVRFKQCFCNFDLVSVWLSSWEPDIRRSSGLFFFFFPGFGCMLFFFSYCHQERSQLYLSGEAKWKNLPDFSPFFLLFPDFLPLFPNFLHFFLLSRGHSAPPLWLRHWLSHLLSYAVTDMLIRHTFVIYSPGGTHILRHTGTFRPFGSVFCKKSLDMGATFYWKIPRHRSTFSIKAPGRGWAIWFLCLFINLSADCTWVHFLQEIPSHGYTFP